MKTAMAVLAVMLSVSAGAKPVYKCEEGGTIHFTDQPCAPGARATELPGLIVTVPPTRSQQDLARAYEERLARERAERDAQWRKDLAEAEAQAERTDRAERKRKAQARPERRKR